MKTVCQCGLSFFHLDQDFIVCHRCKSLVSSGDGKSKSHEVVNPWIPLHRYGPDNANNWVESETRRWFLEWSKTIPSVGCSCQSHWATLMQEMPPDYSSARAFFEWSWKAHDTVSERHSNKPRISLEEAYQIYWR